MNKKLLLLSSSIGLALLTTGCDSSDDDHANGDSTSTEMTMVQAVHASADAPRANVIVNGQTALSGVDYAQTSGYLPLNAGANTFQVDVQLPGDQLLTVIPTTQQSLSADMKYTVFVVGDADGQGNSVEPLIVARDSDKQADANSVDVQVVHAASGVPSVDLYVTAPEVALADANALGSLDYKQSTNELNIDAGFYRVRLVTTEGQALAFDSGPVELTGNSELTIAAVPRADSNSSSPVKLLVLDGATGTPIYDINEPAELRAGHLVVDAPNVDVWANGAKVDALTDVPFKTVSGYLELPMDQYTLNVVETGTEMPVLMTATGDLMQGKDYAAFAVGSVASEFGLEVFEESRRPVATSAVLNVYHAAANPIAESVDVYLTANASIEGATPAIPNFTFKQNISGVYVPAGDYFATVTVAGDPNTVAINAVPVTVENGQVYQVIATDDANGFDLLLQNITD